MFLISSFSGTSVTVADLLQMQQFGGKCQPDSQNELLGNGNTATMRGNSTDFDYIRPMIAGDNFKHIDAKSTARSQQIMVRTYLRENQKNIKIFLDCSESMNFGDRQCTKLVLAMQYISLLAWSAIVNQCTFDIYCFNATSSKAIHLDINDEFDLKNAFSRLVLEVNQLMQAPTSAIGDQPYQLALANIMFGLNNNAQIVLLSDLVYLFDILSHEPFKAICANQHTFIVCPTTGLDYQTDNQSLSIGGTWQTIPSTQYNDIHQFFQAAGCHWRAHRVGDDIPLQHWFD